MLTETCRTREEAMSEVVDFQLYAERELDPEM